MRYHSQNNQYLFIPSIKEIENITVNSAVGIIKLDKIGRETECMTLALKQLKNKADCWENFREALLL